MSAGTVGTVAAVVLGAVFLAAAITKLADPRAWRAQAHGLGVPTPVAAVVPFGEAVVGALLVVQWQRHAVAWVAVGVLVAFTGLLAVRLARGERPPCACFGSWSAAPIGPATLARNAVFIGVGVAAAVL